MAYYFDLYWTYFRLLLKAWSQYRADFVIRFGSTLIMTLARIFFLAIIFGKIHQLQGWSFYEILLIWGLTSIGASLANSLLDIPHRIQTYIQRGDLDRLLIRPPAPLVQIGGEGGFTLTALTGAIVGIAAVATALSNLPNALPWWAIFYLPLSILSGAFILFGVELILACLSFWFINSFSLMQMVGGMSQFGQYPITILAFPLQFLFTWVIPYGMMGFYPAAFLLRGDEYRVYGLLAPLVGFILLGLSLATWEFAIKHYQSTGS